MGCPIRSTKQELLIMAFKLPGEACFMHLFAATLIYLAFLLAPPIIQISEAPDTYTYTLPFYRGSQDGKTCRFTWKSFTSYSRGKSETGFPGQQMQKTWPWISYMEVVEKICQ